MRQSKLTRWLPVLMGGGSSARYKTISQYQTTATEVIDAMASAASWTKVAGTDPADDAVNYVTGTSSIKLTSSGTASTMEKAISFTMTAADRVTVYIYTYSGVGTYALLLAGTTNYATSMTFTFQATGNVPAWRRFDFGPNDANLEGGMTWTTPIVEVRIRSNAATGEASFDGLSYDQNTFSPAVMLTFDDGWDTLYTLGNPILSERHLRATSYIVTALTGTAGYMTAEQLLELYGDGWTIGNHTKNHAYFPTGPMTQEQIEAEINGAITDLQTVGIEGNGPYHLSYPGGGTTTASDAAMAALSMLTGRMNGGGGYVSYLDTLRYIYTVELSSALTLVAAKQWWTQRC